MNDVYYDGKKRVALRRHGWSLLTLLSLLLFHATLAQPGSEGPGTVQNALHFVPSAVNRVIIPDADELDLYYSYTLEVWIRPDEFTALAGILSKYHASGADGYLLRLSGTSPYTGLDFDGMSTAPNILQAGTWYHIAAVKEGASRRLYVNGVAQPLNGLGIVTKANDNDLVLGMDYSPDARYFRGSIDEVRIWNVARTQSEIRATMNSPVDPASAGLVAYYPFNQGVAGADNTGETTVTDVTDNGFNGGAMGFGMNGTTSNWVESYAMVVPTVNNATGINRTGFTAQWSAPTTGVADHYLLEVAADVDFKDRIAGYDGLNVGSNTAYEVTGLPSPATYYFRVRAVSHSAGIGAPSNAFSVSTGTSLAEYSPTDNTLFVKKGGAGNQTGDSWENAIPELADALRWARDQWNSGAAEWSAGQPLRILISKGIYTPVYNAADGQYSTGGGKDNAFVMVPNVQLYGGFDPENHITELTHGRMLPDRSATGVDAQAGTVLSGDVAGDDDPANFYAYRTDNTYHVVVAAGELGAARLDGVSITSGYGRPGVSSEIPVNETMVARHIGAGLSIVASSLEVVDVAIYDNHAGNHAGGLYVVGTTGDANHPDPVTLNRVIVSNNTAILGGGILLDRTGTAVILKSATVRGNTASIGGGIYIGENSSPKLMNTEISSNSIDVSSGAGSGIYSNGSPTLTNVTIVNNTIRSSSDAAGIHHEAGVLTIDNSILWNNTHTDGTLANLFVQNPEHAHISYSLLQGNPDTWAWNSPSSGTNDGGNIVINVSPFTDEAAGKYYLHLGSLAVGAGSNERYEFADGDGANRSLVHDVDVVGNPRVHQAAGGGVIDMGAYESPFASINPTAGILYVNAAVDAEKGPDDIRSDQSGSSWANAITELGEALRWARERWIKNGAAAGWDGDNPLQIWVAIGTYRPLYRVAEVDNWGNATTDRDRAFLLVPNVAVYGGFDPSNDITDLTHSRILPDPYVRGAATENRGTILSGDLGQDDDVDNPEANKADNAYHVVISAGEMGSARLDGLTISGGYGVGETPAVMTVNGVSVARSSGGGLAINNSNLDLSYLAVRGNVSSDGGGISISGMAGSIADPKPVILSQVYISGNTANYGGGMAMNNTGAAVHGAEVTVANNSAEFTGGGIKNAGGAPKLTDMVIRGNRVVNGGGGGIYNDGGFPTLTNILISDNEVNGSGGGVYNTSGGESVLINTVISGNTVSNIGGAIFSNNADLRLTNVTVVRNRILMETAGTTGIHQIGGSLVCFNSVIWNNIRGNGSTANLYVSDPGRADISYSLLQGDPDLWTWNTTSTGTDGGYNIITAASPFRNEAGGDYSLGINSLALDKGSNALLWEAIGDGGTVPAPRDSRWGTDLSGTPRINGSTVDLGALESRYVQLIPTAGILYVNANVDAGKGPDDAFSNRSGNSWNNAIPELRDALAWAASAWDATANGTLQIWVARGKYTPVQPLDPVNVLEDERQETFGLVSRVEIYGGFAGGETHLTERDWKANPTILSGDIDDNDHEQIITDPETQIQGNNSYHVVTGSAADQTAVLDGFTITAGYARGNTADYYEYGAGLFTHTGSPSLSNLAITGNMATYGGGMALYYANAVLADLTIQNNTASDGGGVAILNTTAYFANVNISGNRATSIGGGITTAFSTTHLTNVAISDNTSSIGALVDLFSELTLTNVTVAGNRSTNSGMAAGIVKAAGSQTINNSILWNNINEIDGSVYNLNTSEGTTVINSLLQGDPDSWVWGTQYTGIDGGGNIVSTASPFAKEGGPGYHLGTGSPAINSGRNELYEAADGDNANNSLGSDVDLAGNPRVHDLANGGLIDMGAYEFVPIEQVITVTDTEKTYGDEPFEPGATASSGLPVSYASSDNTIAVAFEDTDDGNKWKIRILKAGAVTITASQQGNGSYQPAEDTFTLTIAKRPVHIGLGAGALLIKEYDGTVTLATAPQLEFDPDDIVDGDEVAVVLADGAASYDTPDVGEGKTVTVALTGISLGGTDATNYVLANTTDIAGPVGTITPATIKDVTFNDGEFIYDGMAHSLFVSGLPADATVTYTGNGQQGAGVYRVTALVGRPNHADLVLEATLTIRKAQPVIVAEGTQRHVYDGTAKAVVAAVVPAELMGALQFSPERSFTNVGSHRVRVYLNESANFLPAEAWVDFAVMAAPQQGLQLPDLTVTYDGRPHSLSVQGLPADAVVVYTGNNRVAAGRYEVKATVHRPNHADTTLQATLTIDRAAAFLAGDEHQVFMYDGGVKSLVVTLSHAEAAPTFHPARGFMDAGTRVVNVSVPQTANHHAVSKSFTVTIVPALRSIDFPALPIKTYGDGDFSPGATASSGEAVSYTSSNPSVAAIASGGSIRIVGAGRAMITARLPENGNYSNRPEVTQSLVVEKAIQAITFNAPAQVTRDAGSVELDVSASSGLPVSLSIDDGQVATLAGTTLQIHRLGTVRITATQAGDGNYKPAEPVTVTIRVTDPSADFAVRIHPAVSPNGDGINEFLMIEGIRDYPENRVTLFSRNGTIVWEAEGYDNSQTVFRGTGAGGLYMAPGTYFYTVEVKENGRWKHKKGYFVLRY